MQVFHRLHVICKLIWMCKIGGLRLYSSRLTVQHWSNPITPLGGSIGVSTCIFVSDGFSLENHSETVQLWRKDVFKNYVFVLLFLFITFPVVLRVSRNHNVEIRALVSGSILKSFAFPLMQCWTRLHIFLFIKLVLLKNFPLHNATFSTSNQLLCALLMTPILCKFPNEHDVLKMQSLFIEKV